jgi:hypothetical protein
MAASGENMRQYLDQVRKVLTRAVTKLGGNGGALMT